MEGVKQAEIYLVDFIEMKGHEQSGLRPALILQNNTLNKKLSTVTVVPLTTNLKYKGFITTYFLEAQKTCLKQDSLVLLYQARTVDKRRLKRKIGTVDKYNFGLLRLRFYRIFY